MFNLNDTSVNTNPKGYYFEPHYPLTISVYSNYIEEAPPQNNYDIPNYAYFSVNDNAFKWRDIYSYGYIDTTGLGINYPFLNGSHYPYGNFMFRIIPEGTDFVDQTIIEDPTIDPCE